MEGSTIDLGAFDTRKGAEEGMELTLRAPNGVELKGFRIRGMDSATYQAASAAQRRRFMQQARRQRALSAAEVDEETYELAAELLIGWPDNLTLEGQPFAFNKANAVAFLKRFPWAHEQIAEAAAVRENFLPRSSAS